MNKELDTFFTCDSHDNRYPLCEHCRRSIKELIAKEVVRGRIDELNGFIELCKYTTKVNNHIKQRLATLQGLEEQPHD